MKTRIRQTNSVKKISPTQIIQGSTPTLEEIRQRAQEIFTARGGAPGRELDDWLQAEQELKQKGAGNNVRATQ